MNLWKSMRKALDPDRALQASVAALIEASAMRYALSEDREVWEPGKALKLFLAGYSGTRNTGADVRVEEMIRQFRHLIGDDQLELSVITYDPELTAGYFRACRQIKLPQVFPPFLYEEVTKHHAVVACEGSMFKSKFAEALSTMMAGALGMANVEGKLSVGYGAEAGKMSSKLESFVRKHCADSLVVCRNEPSRATLGRLGIRTTSGTDTAWTFEPAHTSIGRNILEQAGWDGDKPIVVVCPINPFWWPVRPDLGKAAARAAFGEFKKEHYRSIYFHHESAKADEQFDAYTSAIAGALKTFVERHNVFPILVGMEKLDRRACKRVTAHYGAELPMFISDEYDMYELVSVLWNTTYMVSSRFHAIVCSMPGGVVSGGITMDERIRNLMNDRGQPELFLEVDQDDLEDRLLALFEDLVARRDEIRDGIYRMLPGQLRKMGQMGIEFLDELSRVYPDFPRIDRARTWSTHLPPLPEHLNRILETYE